MRTRVIFISILFSTIGGLQPVIGQQPVKQGPPVPENYCISPLEKKLYNMINEYRRRYDLPPIPLSKSLCYVAAIHVKDLYFNHPDVEPCNFHSWSDKGDWKAFCYPRDEKKNNSVWDKPRELTKYKGKGYEIVYWENNPVMIDSIIPFWKSINYFNNFLMNAGKWQDKKWNALGIGIYENYASAWFGELADPEGEPFICGTIPEKKPVTQVKTDTLKKVTRPDIKPVPQALPKTQATPIVPGKYYIIVSSQQPRVKSTAYAEELVAKGYPDAKVLEYEEKIRVSIMEFMEKQKADSALREIKKTYKDAWLLKR